MFGVGPLELIVILALALIVLGPQKFPEAGRAVGKMLREFRTVTDDLKRDVRFTLDDDPYERYRNPPKVVQRYEDEDDALNPQPVLEKTDPDPPEDNQPGPV